MANNFRKTGTYYISKAGDNLNSGLTPDLPKKTFQGPYNATVVLGSGVYSPTNIVNNNTGVNVIASQFIRCDGAVKLDCTADITFGATGNFNTVNKSNINSDIKSFPEKLIVDLNGNNMYTVNTSAFTANAYLEYSICWTFLNGTIQAYDNTGIILNAKAIRYKFLRSFFKQSEINAVSIQEFYNCGLFDTTVNILSNGANTANLTLVECYLNEASNIILPIGGIMNFRRSNIRSQIIVDGIAYSAKLDKSGNPLGVDPFPGALDIVTIYPNFYTNGNFSEDPLYLNLINNDFRSVSINSPNLRLLTYNDYIYNIGNCLYNSLYEADNSTYWITPSPDGVILNSDNFETTLPEGVIKSLPISLGDLVAIGFVSAVMLRNYDSDQPLGVLNNNVLISTLYGIGTAGCNPQRLTYRMRWSTKVTIPTIGSDWDNSGLVTAGQFSEFEIDEVPRLDHVNIPNGDPNYDASRGKRLVKARWIQLELSIRDANVLM